MCWPCLDRACEQMMTNCEWDWHYDSDSDSDGYERLRYGCAYDDGARDPYGSSSDDS